MSVLGLLNTTIDTYREVRTTDSGGSPVSTFAINLSGVKARVQPVSSNEDIRAGRDFSKTMYRCYVPSDTAVLMSDNVNYLGDTFDIIEKNVYPGTYCELVMELIE